MLKEEVGPDDIAAVVSSWTGTPDRAAAGGRDGEAAADRGVPRGPRGRPAGGGPGGGGRGPPGAGQHRRSGPSDGQLPVPRADRRGQDGAGAGTGGVPVRRRAGDGPHRHERVRGEALDRAPGRRPARLCRVRGGWPADRGGPPPPVLGDPAGRDRGRPTVASSMSCCRCWTTDA